MYTYPSYFTLEQTLDNKQILVGAQQDKVALVVLGLFDF